MKINKKGIVTLSIGIIIGLSGALLVSKLQDNTIDSNKTSIQEESTNNSEIKENDSEVTDSTSQESNKDETKEEYKKDPNAIDTGIATIDGVSVREQNSTSSAYLGGLRTGDKVDVFEKTADGWYKIKYKGSYAYTSSYFIKLASEKTIDNTLNTGVVYNVDELAVREEDSIDSELIGYIPRNQTVEIVRATSTNWYKIKYKNSYGYVSHEYIKLANSKNSSKEQGRDNIDNFVFVGDSFTQRISELIVSKNQTNEVHSQGGSRSSYWLDKVDDMPDKDNVNGVVVLIGVNGVQEEDNIVNTKALINELIVKYPDKDIYVQKVFPVGANFTESDPSNHNKLIEKYNKELESFCKRKENLIMIDSTNGFVDKDGYLTNTTDGLHIDETENERFYENILNAIKQVRK